MQLQWTKTLSIISAILLIIFIISAGFYLLSSEGRLSFIKQKTLKTSSVAFPTVQPTISSGYPLASSQKCKLELIYPSGWNANINPSQSEGNPNYDNNDYNRICILFTDSADPNVINRSGKPQANMTVVVQQTIKGTKVSSASVNDIDTYILASEKAAGAKATNIETVSLGGAKGKYFEITTLPLPSNYVFVIDDVLHTFSWNKEYSGDRKTDLYPFFAIIIQNSHFDQR